MDKKEARDRLMKDELARSILGEAWWSGLLTGTIIGFATCAIAAALLGRAL